MSKFWQSLINAKREDNPWEHYIFGQILTEAQVEEIRGAKIDRTGVLHDGTRSGYKDGAGKQNHQLREYITKENCHKYPELTKIIKELKDPEIRKIIADMVGNKNNFEDAYIRLEILNDTEGFYLKPHCDIPEKLISSLVYVNQTAENLSLGTDLYNEDLKVVKTVPFYHNYGYIFHGPNKWHGMSEGKEIQVERRGIQLNYVTFKTDWPVHED
jgi:membrane-anchored protein YejM (alkaline phosphatase superfamily)